MAAQDMLEPVRFVALGGVWLDEMKKEGKTIHENVLGGSVTYATLGARLFTPDSPSSVCMVIKETEDFPVDVLDILHKWRVSLLTKASEGALAARGIVHYGRDESDRHYERLTTPLDTSIVDLEPYDLLHARAFHFFDVPLATMWPAIRIKDVRQQVYGSPLGDRAPLEIWEPQAKYCRPDTLLEHLSAAMVVDVFSPNHMELACFFENTQEVEFSRGRVEKHATVFVEHGMRTEKGCAVIRCAEHGALIMSRTIPPTWLPAYHQPGSGKVINSTGAGNAFLGSFAVGYQNTGSYIEAAKYGAVGASFVVEQVGVPSLTGEGLNELWNGASVQRRLEDFIKRC